jgi:hypothetical protein
MPSLAHPPITQVISPRIYGLIADSPDLRARLVPGGLVGSPYEILDYQATLVLVDPQGRQAIFRRTQQIRFLQDGVSAILDHLWGDGVTVSRYRNTAGPIGESFKDAGVRHLVIDLERPMGRGETLGFEVERTAMAGFTRPDEWLETTFDHAISQFGQQVIFPNWRPCQWAELIVGYQVEPLQPIRLPDGRTLLQFAITRPQTDLPLTLRWHW